MLPQLKPATLPEGKSKSCPPPPFVHEVDTSLDRLKDQYDGQRPNLIAFYGQKFNRNLMPFDYNRAAAFGEESEIIDNVKSCLLMNHTAFSIITRAWYLAFIEKVEPNHTDKQLREMRRAVVAYLGRRYVNPDATVTDNNDTLRNILDEAAERHPDRLARLPFLRAEAKRHRKAGLTDLSILITEAANALQSEVISEQNAADLRAAELEAEAAMRTERAREAARVKQLRAEEHQEELRLLHDFEHLDRRHATLTAAIERLQALDAEIQSRNYQFNPHAEAKRRRQQIAKRQAERKQHKKHASQCDSTSTLFG